MGRDGHVHKRKTIWIIDLAYVTPNASNRSAQNVKRLNGQEQEEWIAAR